MSVRPANPHPVALAAPVLLGVAGLVLGLPLPYALALVLAPLAVVVVVTAARGSAQALTDLPPLEIPEHEGSRREVAEVSWSLVGSRRAISEKALRELRPVARERLLRLGVDWDDSADAARAEDLLGSRAWATLTCPGGTLPRLPDIEHLVAVLEALVPADQPRQGTTAYDPRSRS